MGAVAWGHANPALGWKKQAPGLASLLCLSPSALVGRARAAEQLALPPPRCGDRQSLGLSTELSHSPWMTFICPHGLSSPTTPTQVGQGGQELLP